MRARVRIFAAIASVAIAAAVLATSGAASTKGTPDRSEPSFVATRLTLAVGATRFEAADQVSYASGERDRDGHQLPWAAIIAAAAALSAAFGQYILRSAGTPAESRLFASPTGRSPPSVRTVPTI